MFRKMLNPDNGLMITLSQISDCIFLSLFWLLGSIPVVTVGASTAALYDATVRAFRGGDKQSWFRFLRVYRESLRPALLPGLIFLGAFAGLVFGLIRVWNGAVAGSLSWMVFSGAAFLGVAALGLLSILFPMLSRFENTTGALLKNTLLLGLANLPRTICLGFVQAVTIFLCVRYVIPLFFLPALAALIGSLFLEPMFKPYMPEEEEKMPLE